MVAFLSILLAVILLGATVYGLHRYQTMEVEYTVDRSMPLPPLEGEEAKARNKQPEQASTQETAAKTGEPEKPRNASQSWLNEVAALKKAGQLDQAMAICEREFPLWGAFNQACIIQRLRLKGSHDDQDRDQILKRLYQLAANAELLHDKSEGAEHLTPIQLKSLDLSRLDGLEHSYQKIGYAHLRLIRKSDVKEMLANWGRPQQHELPRNHHQPFWAELTSRLG